MVRFLLFSKENSDGYSVGLSGAQLLVENNVWTTPKKQKPLYSTDEGFAVARGNG